MMLGNATEFGGGGGGGDPPRPPGGNHSSLSTCNSSGGPYASLNKRSWAEAVGDVEGVGSEHKDPGVELSMETTTTTTVTTTTTTKTLRFSSPVGVSSSDMLKMFQQADIGAGERPEAREGPEAPGTLLSRPRSDLLDMPRRPGGGQVETASAPFRTLSSYPRRGSGRTSSLRLPRRSLQLTSVTEVAPRSRTSRPGSAVDVSTGAAASRPPAPEAGGGASDDDDIGRTSSLRLPRRSRQLISSTEVAPSTRTSRPESAVDVSTGPAASRPPAHEAGGGAASDDDDISLSDFDLTRYEDPAEVLRRVNARFAAREADTDTDDEVNLSSPVRGGGVDPDGSFGYAVGSPVLKDLSRMVNEDDFDEKLTHELVLAESRDKEKDGEGAEGEGEEVPGMAEGKGKGKGKEKSKVDRDPCAICQDDIEPGSYMTTLVCKHAFHRECIKNWLCNGKDVCPVCNGDPFRLYKAWK